MTMIKGMPYANMARSIATSMRGEVNHIYKTTQQGFYYFSCSWHGGFIVAKDALTDEQLARLQKHNLDKWMITACSMYSYRTIYVDWKEKTKWKTNYKTGYSYRNPSIERGEYNVEFLVFEEDCDWALVVYLLGVYRNDYWANQLTAERKAKLDEYALNSMKGYRQEVLAREGFIS